MRANEFQGWWSARFGLNLPLGWVLRNAFRERWVRFHKLPASKRYPETAQELAEILRRHAALTKELFSAGSDCWFVTVTFERATSDHLTLPELPGLTLERVIQTSCPDPVVADDVTIWAASVTWDRDRFEEARRAIVDDQLKALWVAEASAEVFAPYDGGVDLVLATASRRETLATRYRHWLPGTPSGL